MGDLLIEFLRTQKTSPTADVYEEFLIAEGTSLTHSFIRLLTHSLTPQQLNNPTQQQQIEQIDKTNKQNKHETLSFVSFHD